MLTTQDVYAALEKRHAESQPFHRWLGASLVGASCTRFVALSFRCAFDDKLSGRTLRVFANGHAAFRILYGHPSRPLFGEGVAITYFGWLGLWVGAMMTIAAICLLGQRRMSGWYLAVIGGLALHAGVLLWVHRQKLHRLLAEPPAVAH